MPRFNVVTSRFLGLGLVVVIALGWVVGSSNAATPPPPPLLPTPTSTRAFTPTPTRTPTPTPTWTPTRTPTRAPTATVVFAPTPPALPTPTAIPVPTYEPIVISEPCAPNLPEDIIVLPPPPLPAEAASFFVLIGSLQNQLVEVCRATKVIFETTPKELEVAGYLANEAASLARKGQLEEAYTLALKAVELEEKVMLKHKTGADVVEAYAKAIDDLADAIYKLRLAITE